MICSSGCKSSIFDWIFTNSTKAPPSLALWHLQWASWRPNSTSSQVRVYPTNLLKEIQVWILSLIWWIQMNCLYMSRNLPVFQCSNSAVILCLFCSDTVIRVPPSILSRMHIRVHWASEQQRGCCGVPNMPKAFNGGYRRMYKDGRYMWYGVYKKQHPESHQIRQVPKQHKNRCLGMFIPHPPLCFWTQF